MAGQIKRWVNLDLLFWFDRPSSGTGLGIGALAVMVFQWTL
ncbi:MAG: hypothetical protein AB7G18_11895 [Pyrinomonadaceae bacterium]